MRSDTAARCSVRRPGWLRHPAIPAESCCLPTLTRFTSGRCAGPGHRTQHRDGVAFQASGSLRPTLLPHQDSALGPVRDALRHTGQAAGSFVHTGPDHDQLRASLCRHPGDRHHGAPSCASDAPTTALSNTRQPTYRPHFKRARGGSERDRVGLGPNRSTAGHSLSRCDQDGTFVDAVSCSLTLRVKRLCARRCRTRTTMRAPLNRTIR